MYLKCFHLASFIFRKLVCWYFQTHISRKLFPCPRTGYLYGIKLLYSSHTWHICKCVIWVVKDAVNSLYCVPGTSEVLQHFYCLFHEMFFYLQCAFFSPFICGWFCFGLVFSGVWNERRKSEDTSVLVKILQGHHQPFPFLLAGGYERWLLARSQSSPLVYHS